MLHMALAAVALTSVGGCTAFQTPPAPVPVAVAAPPPAPVDPFASSRPVTASVGVTMPDAKDFLHPWDISTYVMRVTLFGTLPAMNGGVAFVGDSLTDVGRWPEAYPNLRVRNFGIFGDTTVGLQHRISQVVDAKPSTVFLMIGTNDIEYGRTPEQIVANIDVILDRLASGLPGAKVFVESLLPRQPEFNDRIVAVNALLKADVAKRGLTYIDLYSHFVAEGGRLDPTLSSDDIHLSGQGYTLWRSLIRDDVSVGVVQKKPIPAHRHKRHAHKHKV